MGTKDRRLELESWVEQLVRPPPGASVDALLLDLVQACTRVPALALWLASSAGWAPARARGAAHLLPSEARVRAVLAGALDGELGERESVLSCGDARDGAALALGGGRAQDPDLAHALLVTYWCLEQERAGPVPGRHGHTPAETASDENEPQPPGA